LQKTFPQAFIWARRALKGLKWYVRPGRAGITRSFLYDTLFPVALHRHAYAALYFALAVRAHPGT
jgi:hypothetical protein